MPHPSHPRGFTLIEMLLVVAIIGILVTMLAPRMQMMGGPRVTAAARVLTQLTRYARTMALLNQVETVIRISPDGVIRVDAAASAPAPEAAESVAPPVGELPAGTAPDSEAAAPAADAGGPASFSEAVAVERRLENVTVAFLGYTDTLSELRVRDAEAGASETGGEVHFRSNGTCRPHRYKLTDATGVEAVVTVDILGLARVETGGGGR
jgi:prepilin-type N-terminal cleavage/methylation domain-containing protein